MNATTTISQRLAAAIVLATAGCATGPVDRDVLAISATPGTHVTLADFEAQQAMTGSRVEVPRSATPKVPDSHVEASVSTKDVAGDALTMRWKGAWYASLRLELAKPADLRPFLADGALEFDLDVVDMAKGGLTFTTSCGPDCGRKLPWTVPSRALAGKGWQHLSLPMRCFAHAGDAFSAVTQAFTLDSSGTGEAAVANVRFVRHGKGDTPCPDYRTESVTPRPLEQVWALDWWIPRHQQKLAEIAALRAAHVDPDVVFVGDSITHNWEKDGSAVWQANYARHHALDLGFGGDHTENVLWRLQHGELDGIHPKVVVLMIGTNNTGDRLEDPATTAAGIRRLLDEIRMRQPDARVLLLAVFPRDEKPDSPLRRINDRINTMLPGFADGRHVVFLDIDAALLNADGTLSRDVMPDLLHPNEKGYAIWATQMAPTLQRLLADGSTHP